ncbi:uncharacterized protein ColSpa_05171 [Colletotrichum spaethianum]|uniref:Uncharacterized protein n=1 Tax=Colletotrichum spaethianum TaxID=700344 RepID=A0AA37P001_9PEZI|nr:uncharacterized protein ColSpa_05171 [Colletotrichum spaethianum]GKT44990.1 hypothetical protein ColSpa_05171 [Colletotrichum spaethianum]
MMLFWKPEQVEEKSFEERTTPPVHPSGDNGGDLENGESGMPNGSREKQPTDRITGRQIFYIFGLDGIGAAILSGGINFALAYANVIKSLNPLTRAK